MSEKSTIDLAKKRLENPETLDSLARIFAHYYDDVQDIVAIATVENCGRRPDNLSNEFFSCFHHLARGLCGSDTDVKSEFISAHKSHLKRVMLDSYKISINAFLREDEKLREVLDYLILAEDFSKYVPDGLVKVNQIKADARYIKERYRIAKNKEGEGLFDESIDAFNDALVKCYELRKQIEVFTSDKTYLLACAREVKLQEQKIKDRKFTVWMVILSAILAAMFTALASYYIPRICSWTHKSWASSSILVK